MLPCKGTQNLAPCRSALTRRDASVNAASVSAQCNQQGSSSAGEHPLWIHYVASSQTPFQFCTSSARQPRTLLSRRWNWVRVCVSCFNLHFFILLKFLSNLMHGMYVTTYICHKPATCNFCYQPPNREFILCVVGTYRTFHFYNPCHLVFLITSYRHTTLAPSSPLFAILILLMPDLPICSRIRVF